MTNLNHLNILKKKKLKSPNPWLTHLTQVNEDPYPLSLSLHSQSAQPKLLHYHRHIKCHLSQQNWIMTTTNTTHSLTHQSAPPWCHHQRFTMMVCFLISLVRSLLAAKVASPLPLLAVGLNSLLEVHG